MLEAIGALADYREKDPGRMLAAAIVAGLTLPCLFTEHWPVHYLNKCLMVWFHEGGHGVMHVFWTWGWFGRLLTYAGGGIFQIAVPLLFMAAVASTGQVFRAAFFLFLIAVNFVDISYYAADGALRERPLIFNMDKDAHDWGNILSMLNLRGQAALIGWWFWLLGAVSWGLGVAATFLLGNREHGRL